MLVPDIHIRVVLQQKLGNCSMSQDHRRLQWCAPATLTFVWILPTRDNEVIHDATNIAKGRIIKGRWFRWDGRFADSEPRTGRNVVYVVNRNPYFKMVPVRVKETVHPVLYVGRYVLVLRMMEPVLCRIFGKREVVGDVIIQLK